VYTDGATQPFTLAAPDWQSAPTSGSAAIVAAYQSRPNNARHNARSYIMFSGIALDPTKTVRHVRLPAVGPTPVAKGAELDVFATAVADTTTPTTLDDVPATWQRTDVTVTLTTSDSGGVAKTYYETGQDPATPTAASAVYDPAGKPVLRDGERIRYFSVDSAGNRSW
jgi:hypothetical protein